MIGRRAVLSGGVCLLAARRAAAALPIPNGNRLAFNVVRGSTTIGTHILTFHPDGDRLTVAIAVDIAVSFGPIVLFRYRHRAEERWAGGQVQSLDAETNNDGTKLETHMRRQNDALVVASTGHRTYTAPPDALPATHWNRAMLNGPFINTQNGELMHPTVTPLGAAIISGCRHEAWGFALRGDADLDTWYDGVQRWVGLRFNGSDGSEIRYEQA
jgi:Family of unknown function (DUF6134)